MLPVPLFFSPANAESWSYSPNAGDLFVAARSWASRHRISPSAADSVHTLLLLVDLQKDFCLPQGSLYVGGRSGRGAVEDNQRLCSFVYRNLADISETLSTLDSHLPHQIFFPSFWLDEAGEPVPAHTIVSVRDVREGKFRPREELAAWLAGGDEGWLRRQAQAYCDELEARGRYSLYLWPPHCLVGSAGHGFAGVVEEARLFHAYARGAEAGLVFKGLSPLTEHYSVLGPEILLAHDGSALAEAEGGVLDRLLAADRLVVAGQASSHCVKSTLEDLLAAIEERGSALARRVYLLEDCMSAVVVPSPTAGAEPLADFSEQAEGVLDRCRQAGMHVVASTDPMDAWPQ